MEDDETLNAKGLFDSTNSTVVLRRGMQKPGTDDAFKMNLQKITVTSNFKFRTPREKSPKSRKKL